MREANPVGIIERCCPFQALDQCRGIIKLKRINTDLLSKWVWVVGMPGERANLFPHRQETACNVFTSIAECPGNDVYFVCCHNQCFLSLLCKSPSQESCNVVQDIIIIDQKRFT